VIHDGSVVNIFSATDILHGMKARVERHIGLKLVQAASKFQLVVPQTEVCAINARKQEKNYG